MLIAKKMMMVGGPRAPADEALILARLVSAEDSSAYDVVAYRIRLDWGTGFMPEGSVVAGPVYPSTGARMVTLGYSFGFSGRSALFTALDAASQLRCMVTQDGGDTWTDVTSVIEALPDLANPVSYIRGVSENAAGEWFACVITEYDHPNSPNRLLKSTNKGLSWAVAETLPGTNPDGGTVSTGDIMIWYVENADGDARARSASNTTWGRDFGGAWGAVSGSIEAGGPIKFTGYDPVTDQWFLAAGATYRPVATGGTPDLYRYNAGYVQRSTDFGDTWANVEASATSTWVPAVVGSNFIHVRVAEDGGLTVINALAGTAQQAVGQIQPPEGYVFDDPQVLPVTDAAPKQDYWF